MVDDPKPIDKTKPPPLHVRVGETPGSTEMKVMQKGVEVRDLIEVDVLGCWARRWQRNEYGGYILDDDGVACVEVIYGFFTVEWKAEEEYVSYGYGMGPFF
jgi:hypothetical protein